MISSTANRQVKTITALKKSARRRKEEGLFVAEGPRMCAEIPRERIETLYISESFAQKKEAEQFLNFPKTELVTDTVFGVLSDTQNPQGVLALVKQFNYTLHDILSPGNPLILVLEHLQDPGNLGTLMRAGEGAGITGILMDSQTADVTNPKAIRSTMGSVFRVPYVYSADLVSDISFLKDNKVRIYAADVRGSELYDKASYTKGTAFLIGNEAAGLSDEALGLSDMRVRIPILGKVESLNAAVAGSVLLFEAAAQRRNKQG